MLKPVTGCRGIQGCELPHTELVRKGELRRLLRVVVRARDAERAAVALQSQRRGQLARRQLPERARARVCPVWASQRTLAPAEPEKAAAVPQPKSSKTLHGESCSKGAADSSMEQARSSSRQAGAAMALTRARRNRRRRARGRSQLHQCMPQPGNRRARRLADPEVQARRDAYRARVARVEGEARREAVVAAEQSSGAEQSNGDVNNGAGAGKRIYTKEYILSLRPRPTCSLSAATPIFVPRAARYSCFARAVSLGLADAPACATQPVWRRPVLSAAARDLCARVHGLLQRA